MHAPIGRKGKPLCNWYGDLYDENGTYDLEAQYRRKRDKGSWKYVPAQTKNDLWERGQNACVNCGTTNNLTIDHIVPVSYGGTSELSNLQLICSRCHGQKEQACQDLYNPSDRKPLDERYLREEKDGFIREDCI